MQLQNLMKWNVRASLVYAFGVWTMIGTYGYYTYTGAYDVKPENKTGTIYGLLARGVAIHCVA